MRVRKKYYLPLNATMAEKKLLEGQAIEDISRLLVRMMKYVGSDKSHAIFMFDFSLFDTEVLENAIGRLNAKAMLGAMRKGELAALRPKNINVGDKYKRPKT